MAVFSPEDLKVHETVTGKYLEGVCWLFLQLSVVLPFLQAFIGSELFQEYQDMLCHGYSEVIVLICSEVCTGNCFE